MVIGNWELVEGRELVIGNWRKYLYLLLFPITNYPSPMPLFPITHYQLPNPNAPLPHYPLPITHPQCPSSPLPITHSPLPNFLLYPGSDESPWEVALKLSSGDRFCIVLGGFPFVLIKFSHLHLLFSAVIGLRTRSFGFPANGD